MDHSIRIDQATLSELERYRLLVEAIADYAIYMLDPTGHVASWNAGARRFKGYEEAEILGQHFSRFYSEEDRLAGIPQRALRTAASEGRFEAEGWRIRKDGSRMWAHVVIDAIRGDDGVLLGFAKITRDISERHEAQLALQEAREQLVQSQKMEAIGQLTGGVAHDFNNLLTAILSSLELLKKRLPDDPAILKLVDNAMLGADRGAALTQRMLAFARRQNLRLAGVDLRDLVAGMSELLQRSLGAEIAIELRFSEAPVIALTDPHQLESALLNLAVNARDALDGRGKIVIGARQEWRAAWGNLPAGQYACLWLSDSGPGMSEETLSRATEPFFTTKGVGKGTGLGLSMVQGVAEQSGGRLLLKSPPGAGLTAEIWLPVAQSKETRAPVSEQPAAQDDARGKLKIVAVDDDALVLLNTVALLEDLGHTVFEAHSGDAAMALVRKEAVDLVITDFAMPGMNGGQLAAAIHAEWPGLPVILASGYAELPDGSAVDLPRLGKPFMQADLERAIARVCAA
jgi:PAS domain S-box-containing protein